MSRKLCARNIYDSKPNVFTLDGIWAEVLGSPEKNGAWLIWGAEKNGKTSFALQLADYMSRTQVKPTKVKGELIEKETADKVWYISAEEGLGDNFRAAMLRAKIAPSKRMLHFDDYQPLDELSAELKKKKAARIVFLDNITIYADELKNGGLRNLMKEHPSVLFVFLAHEERGEPSTATAKLCRRLAKVIVHVKGLACTVSGRCPGGKLTIDEQGAALYHGQE